ncbi:MAG: hypothetical protein ACT4P3_10740 [Betaproteobacteria bacterium]
MKKRLLLALCIPIGIQACAIGNPEYPANWDPLVPPAVADCRRFEGWYADRGQTRDGFSQRSLTRELFGYREEWRAATRVRLEFPAEDVLQVTVWAGESKVSTRNLHAAVGDFRCENGRLTVRDKRWVAEDLVAGHENVTVELHEQGKELVALVKEFTLAVAFVIVPFVADATHWYRFRRLPN